MVSEIEQVKETQAEGERTHAEKGMPTIIHIVVGLMTPW
jgi:hypothetical protein